MSLYIYVAYWIAYNDWLYIALLRCFDLKVDEQYDVTMETEEGSPEDFTESPEDITSE